MEITLRWIEAVGTLVIAGFAAWVTFRGHRYETSKPRLTWLRPSFYRVGEVEKEEQEGGRLILAILVAVHNAGGQPAVISNAVVHVRPPKGSPFPLILQYELEPADDSSGRQPLRLVPARPLLVQGHSITTAMWVFGIGDTTGTDISPPPDRWLEGTYTVKGFIPPYRQPKFCFSIHVDRNERLAAGFGSLRLSSLKRAQELVDEQAPFLTRDFVGRSAQKGA